jgi:TonB family protein
LQTIESVTLVKRYLFFLGLALFIHVLFFIPWLVTSFVSGNQRGGGSGSNISISIESPKLQDGPIKKKKNSQRTQSSKNSFDPYSGKTMGRETSHESGPGQGLGSGKKGSDAVLATIRKRIEHAKRYPLLAQRRRITGQTKVSFKINEDGTIKSLRILKKSGVSLLDQESMETIRRATPFPYYPEPIEIVIEYSL